MASVSQNGGRKPRPWTAQEQVTAEVAAACGVGYEEIGRLIDRRGAQVRYHLVADAKEVQRRCSKQWSANNPERCREISRLKQQRWRKENPELAKEAARRYWLAHKEQVITRGKEWAKVHRDRINASKRRRYAESAEHRERRKESSRRWYRDNPEKARRARMAWAERNTEKLFTYKREYYQRNKERVLRQTREYRLRNPEIGRVSSRRWATANPEKRKLICARYREANRHKTREASRKCQSVRRSQKNRSLLPITTPLLMIRYALFAGKCCYCGARGKLEADHVLPLSRRGLDEADNIVPACRRCNASKNARPVETWYRRQPFFTETRWRKIQRHCPAAVAGQLPLALAA